MLRLRRNLSALVHCNALSPVDAAKYLYARLTIFDIALNEMIHFKQTATHFRRAVTRAKNPLGLSTAMRLVQLREEFVNQYGNQVFPILTHSSNISVIVTSDAVLSGVVNACKTGNAYLCTDATGHIVRRTADVDSRKTFLYTLLVRVPTIPTSNNVLNIIAAEIITSDHSGNHLLSLYNLVMLSLRRLNGGKQVRFRFAVTDNSDTLRFVMNMTLNQTNTHESLAKASSILLRTACFSTARNFVPILGCIAHQAKCEAEFFRKKCRVSRQLKALCITVRLAVLQMTDLSNIHLLCTNFIALLYRRYRTPYTDYLYEQICHFLGLAPVRWDGNEDAVFLSTFQKLQLLPLADSLFEENTISYRI